MDVCTGMKPITYCTLWASWIYGGKWGRDDKLL